MNEPLSVVIRKTTAEIINTLNSAGLPLDIMTYIVQDILSACKAQAEAAYQNDLKQMKESEAKEDGTE